MASRRILIVCGPIGAGKTTVATRLHERLASRGVHYRLLHSDAFPSRTYDRMTARVRDSSDDWILDGTFYRAGMRRRFRDLGDVRIVQLTAPIETCLERNRQRAEPVEERAVHVVFTEFEPPDADVFVDTVAHSPDETVDLILRALRPWLEGDGATDGGYDVSRRRR